MSFENRPSMLAVSKAGHDKGKLYVVLSEEEPYCYLADGKAKCLDNPKKKKRMHLQVITHLPEEIKNSLAQIREDRDVRCVLKAYSGKQP